MTECCVAYQHTIKNTYVRGLFLIDLGPLLPSPSPKSRLMINFQ